MVRASFSMEATGITACEINFAIYPLCPFFRHLLCSPFVWSLRLICTRAWAAPRPLNWYLRLLFLLLCSWVHFLLLRSCVKDACGDAYGNASQVANGDASCYASTSLHCKVPPASRIQSALLGALLADSAGFVGAVYSKQASSDDSTTAATPATAHLFSCFKTSPS